MIARPASGMVEIPRPAKALINVLFPEPGPPVIANRRSKFTASIPSSPYAAPNGRRMFDDYCPVDRNPKLKPTFYSTFAVTGQLFRTLPNQYTLHSRGEHGKSENAFWTLGNKFTVRAFTRQ